MKYSQMQLSSPLLKTQEQQLQQPRTQLIDQILTIPSSVIIKDISPFSNTYKYMNIKQEIEEVEKKSQGSSLMLIGISNKLLEYYQQDLQVMQRNHAIYEMLSSNLDKVQGLWESIRTRNKQIMVDMKRKSNNKLDMTIELREEIYKLNSEVREFCLLSTNLGKSEFYTTVDIQHIFNKYSEQELDSIMFQCEYYCEFQEITQFYEANIQQINAIRSNIDKGIAGNKIRLLQLTLMSSLETGLEIK